MFIPALQSKKKKIKSNHTSNPRLLLNDINPRNHTYTQLLLYLHHSTFFTIISSSSIISLPSTQAKTKSLKLLLSYVECSSAISFVLSIQYVFQISPYSIVSLILSTSVFILLLLSTYHWARFKSCHKCFIVCLNNWLWLFLLLVSSHNLMHYARLFVTSPCTMPQPQYESIVKFATLLNFLNVHNIEHYVNNIIYPSCVWPSSSLPNHACVCAR